jgi:hypothetical protein
MKNLPQKAKVMPDLVFASAKVQFIIANLIAKKPL